MSTTKHTPGPWRAFVQRSVVDVEDASGKVIIHWAGFDSSDTPLKEQRANARLIAAAPVLLAALREYHKANGLHHDEDARLFDLGEAALAAAGDTR
jgi:hypothetical protein